MVRRFVLLIIGLLFITGTLFAKEYDLQSIIKLAIERNKDIKLAQADLRMASALKKEAVSAALPTVDLDFGYNRNLQQTFFYFNSPEGTQKFSITYKNEFQFNAILSQTLFSFKVGKAIQAASDFRKLTAFQYDSQFQAIITGVKKAFYQALLLKTIYELARESEESALENYQNIKLKYESGVVSEFELLQAEVRWQNSIPETMQARKNFQVSLNNLKALVSLPQSENIQLSGDLESFPVFPDSISMEEVLRKHPMYNALVWERKLREKNIIVQKSNNWPELDGRVMYNYGARSDAFRLQNDNDNVVVGLTLKVPLFTGGFGSAQVQKARIELDKTDTQLSIALDDLQIQLTNIYLLLKESYQRIVAAQKSIGSARRAFEIAQTRVANNMATQLELKDSRLFLDQAQVNYYAATYDYLEAYFDWARVTGNVNTEGL